MQKSLNWRYKDGQEVRADARIKITRDCTRLETYNLTLNLVKREDAGDYEVKATNNMGSAGTKSHVKVLSKCQLYSFKVPSNLAKIITISCRMWVHCKEAHSSKPFFLLLMQRNISIL